MCSSTFKLQVPVNNSLYVTMLVFPLFLLQRLRVARRVFILKAVLLNTHESEILYLLEVKCLVLYLKRNSRLSAKSHLLWKAEFEIKMHILCRMAPSKNTYSFKDMPLSHLKNGMVDKCWNMTGTWYVKCFLLWFGRWDSGEICMTIYKYQVFQNSYYRHQNTFLTLLILSLKLFC